MRMLRWTCRVIRLDGLRHECMRNLSVTTIANVTNIAGKKKENRLRWFGDVERRNKENIFKTKGEIVAERNRVRGRPFKK